MQKRKSGFSRGEHLGRVGQELCWGFTMCKTVFQYLKGPTTDLEKEFLHGHLGTGQVVMGLNQNRGSSG